MKKTYPWLAAIELIVSSMFWGIGYYFGFSLVSLLTAGGVYSEEFSVLIKGRETPHPYWMFTHEGKFYLIAEVVGVIGWTFLTAVTWGVTTFAGLV